MPFAIGGSAGRPIFNALRELVRDAEQISVAVSYVQLGGWDLLWSVIPRNLRGNVRILCTDQLGISDPKAVRAIMNAGVPVRAYRPTDTVFHPKVFIGHRANAPDRYVLGSANLSRSALLKSVEVNQHGLDGDGTLAAWFEGLFTDDTQSSDFDEVRLKALENAYAARIKSRLVFQRTAASLNGQPGPDQTNAATTVASIFAGLLPDPGVAPLNYDKAGNNVRRLGIIREVLQGVRPLRGKALSEMRLLGLADGAQLNALGRRAASARTTEDVGRIWITWLKHATDAELSEASPSGQLAQARSAFAAFWTMRPEVREFFINHSERPTARQKKILQTIELLANSGRRVSELTLDDVSTLSIIVRNTEDLPPAAALAVINYLDNKGARGWPYDDRRIAVESWRDA